ncbi:MAG: radical SAM protein, partial [bacterium]
MGYWVGKDTIEGVQPTLRLSRGSVVVGIDPDLVVAADLEGRPWRLVDGDTTYRWSLNGGVLAVRRGPDGGRERRRLDMAEAVRVWEQTRDRLTPLLEAPLLRSGDGGGERLSDRFVYAASPAEDPERAPEESEQRLAGALGRLAAVDAERLREDASRFSEVYSPVGILPPDQYMALVLQITRGCSFNTCTFCTFYRDFPFRIKEREELVRHMDEVEDFLGRGIELRRSIFLGDANALVVPMDTLRPLVAEVARRYGDHPASEGGLHAFLDGFSGAKKEAEDFRELKELGLSRVSVGMESGHDPLLEWLRKPGSSKDVEVSVRAMKEAGLEVTMIALLGAGGSRYDEGHVRDTVSLLSSLPLDRRDIVYFSEFVDQPDAPYGVIAAEEGVAPLDGVGMARQRERVAGALRPL